VSGSDIIEVSASFSGLFVASRPTSCTPCSFFCMSLCSDCTSGSSTSRLELGASTADATVTVAGFTNLPTDANEPRRRAKSDAWEEEKPHCGHTHSFCSGTPSAAGSSPVSSLSSPQKFGRRRGAGVTGKLGRSTADGKSVRMRLSRRAFRERLGEPSSSVPVACFKTWTEPRLDCESMIERT
jgi:hypothetical protein